MPTGGTGGDVSRPFGSGGAQEQPRSRRGSKADTALNTLKDALRPGDLKARDHHQKQVNDNAEQAAKTAPASSIFEQGMKGGEPTFPEDATMPRPATFIYDDDDYADVKKNEDMTSDGSGGIFETTRFGQDRRRGSIGSEGGISPKQRRGSVILDALKPTNKTKEKDDNVQTKQSGVSERTPANYTFDRFPGGDGGGDAKGGNDADAMPRVSALDARGSIGKEFTTKGTIGGTADRVGGPFAQEGVVGRQFTERGSVGGKVQDHLGHGDSTRRT